jgi:hypothetical protein
MGNNMEFVSLYSVADNLHRDERDFLYFKILPRLLPQNKLVPNLPNVTSNQNEKVVPPLYFIILNLRSSRWRHSYAE